MHQRRYHILVADEDDEALTRAVTLLKRRDYVVAGAPTPEEAEWWVSVWPIDLVVAAPRFGAATGVQLVLDARTTQPEIAGLVTASSEGAPDRLDARRHGVGVVPPAGDTDKFLAGIAQCLSGLTRRQRWPRKEITAPIPMRIGHAPGRLMDVSYGGLKFELTEEPFVLRSPVSIDFPRADLTLLAEVIWSARRGQEHACVFGAAVTPEPAPAAEWRAFVDRIG